MTESGVLVNAQMDARCCVGTSSSTRPVDAMLRCARERGMLSARGQHRALRVARTIADLEAANRVRSEHLALALSWRPEAGFRRAPSGVSGVCPQCARHAWLLEELGVRWISGRAI